MISINEKLFSCHRHFILNFEKNYERIRYNNMMIILSSFLNKISIIYNFRTIFILFMFRPILEAKMTKLYEHFQRELHRKCIQMLHLRTQYFSNILT